MKVLIVDDDLDTLESFSDLIICIKPEAEILLASTGCKALDLITTNKDISVVLCDVKMSPMDGFALKKALNTRGIRIPLVFMSAMSPTRYELIGRQLGAVGFLYKPVTGNDLVDAIDKAISYSQIISYKPELLQAVAELVITQPSIGAVSKPLSENYIIGRSNNADIRLISRKSSREHALLNRTVQSYLAESVEHHYRVIDLSRNGFNVNGNKVSGYWLLKHGDSMEFPECLCKYFVLDREQLTNPDSTYT